MPPESGMKVVIKDKCVELGSASGADGRLGRLSLLPLHLSLSPKECRDSCREQHPDSTHPLPTLFLRLLRGMKSNPRANPSFPRLHLLVCNAARHQPLSSSPNPPALQWAQCWGGCDVTISQCWFGPRSACTAHPHRAVPAAL